MSDLRLVSSILIPEGQVRRIVSGGVELWRIPSQGGGMPEGYTVLDYIEFTGAQTVDTGVVPCKTTIIEAEFTRSVSGAMYLYGVRSQNNTASVTAYLTSSGAWRFGNVYKNMTPLVKEDSHHTVHSAAGIELNGVLTKYTSTVKAFTAVGTLTLGSARYHDGSYGSPTYVGRVYSFKMYEGDELLIDYIPCRNDSGVCGFWDRVRGQFKGSVTSTVLLGGLSDG